MNDKKKIEALFAMDDRTLFIELGKSLPIQMGIEPLGDDDSLYQYAVKWYEKNKTKIIEKLCSSEQFKQQVEAVSKSGRAEISAVVLDGLNSYFFGAPFSIFIIATLIVKYEIHGMCK